MWGDFGQGWGEFGHIFVFLFKWIWLLLRTTSDIVDGTSDIKEGLKKNRKKKSFFLDPPETNKDLY